MLTGGLRVQRTTDVPWERFLAEKVVGVSTANAFLLWRTVQA